jgi:hypothetical protein
VQAKEPTLDDVVRNFRRRVQEERRPVHQLCPRQRADAADQERDLRQLFHRGVGLANSHWARDSAHFDELLSRRFDDGGPVLVAAKIDDKPGAAQAPRDPVLIRQRFMKGLGTGRGAALE